MNGPVWFCIARHYRGSHLTMTTSRCVLIFLWHAVYSAEIYCVSVAADGSSQFKLILNPFHPVTKEQCHNIISIQAIQFIFLMKEISMNTFHLHCPT